MISSFEPHPAQKIILDATGRKYTGFVVMIMAGRRFGKTLLSLSVIVKRAIEVPGSRLWYVTHTKDQAYRNAWRTLLNPRRRTKGRKGFDPPLLPNELIKKKRDDRHTVELYNDSIIELFGIGNEIFKLGAGIDFVVLDEFPGIPYSLWYDVINPMLADVNGDAMFIGTVPDPKKHDITIEFIDMFEQGLARPTDRLKSFNFSSFDNPHISHEKIRRDIEEYKKKGREQDALRLFFGKYTREYGFVFPAFGDRHIINPIEIPKEWTRVNAMDPHPHKPHFSNWGAFSQDNTLFTYRERVFEHHEQGRPMTVSEVSNEILAIEAAEKEVISAREIDPTYAKVKQSQLKGKSILDLFRDNGLYYREAIRDFAPFFDDMTERLTSDPPRYLITEDCPQTIRQIQNLRWEAYASPRAREEKGSKDRPKDVDNDLVDCVKYILNGKTRHIDPTFINRLKSEVERRWVEKRLY
jgi:hypothetical protein